ncbi:uncharacterized protein E0L32_006287 [Thyridium curvatum]|uniref:Uncharacterized protein n=1 Tax=Thyridium curvatum TaxID=1093900 RepID=A0A507B3K4_9PEZI|nr:uncharacterized protein E0L32_006287 [Thyridium curvatum]TPX13314.1 hypothetical protein E0L32_006287 [Thyridium curvatum]
MRLAHCILGFFASSTALLFPREPAGVVTADRYSSCTADRGYVTGDANLAAHWLYTNVTRTGGLRLTQGECVYGRHNTTIVSLCNGAARNRTVTQGEVRRGIEQLQKDCGADGAFSGIHVVNNLTFSAYGVFGGKDLAAPQDRSPGGSFRLHKFAIPACEAAAFTGVDRYDCPQKEGHTLNPDGSCGETNPDNGCAVYCEVKRTYFVGPETLIDGPEGDRASAGQKINIVKGKTITVGGGVSIGVEGVLKEVIGAGVNFEYSMEVSTSTEQEWEGQPSTDPNVWARWVTFAKYVESCGSVSRRRHIMASVGPPSQPALCVDDLETIPNVCSITPWIKDGKPQAEYVQSESNPLIALLVQASSRLGVSILLLSILSGTILQN